MTDRFAKFNGKRVSFLERGNKEFVEGRCLLPTFCLFIVFFCLVIGATCFYLCTNILLYNYHVAENFRWGKFLSFVRDNWMLIGGFITPTIVLIANLYLSFYGHFCEGKAVRVKEYEDYQLVTVEYRLPTGEMACFDARSNMRLQDVSKLIEEDHTLIVLYALPNLFRAL